LDTFGLRNLSSSEDCETLTVNSDSENCILDSKSLFGSKKLISIQHEGSVYKLRITRRGKLILNK
jgi:hemin uptake protein HemP